MVTLRNCLMLTALAMFLAAGVFAGDSYPNKAIQVIIPLAPGGDTDVNGRLFCKYLEEDLKQPVAVINIEGAGGTIGSRRALDADPDGYTVLFYHTELLLPKIVGMVDFDIFDFDMCGIGILDNTTVLATYNGAPYSTLKELQEYARANPMKVEFGIQTGGYPHLVGLALEKALDVQMNLVDVGGNAAKTVALKGQKTDVINTQYGLTKDYFIAGDFVCLGLLSEERNPLLPDLPTAKEQGFPMVFNKFFFMAMPKGTPPEIIDAFSAAMERVAANPDFQKDAARLFITPHYLNPAAATEYAKNVHGTLIQYQDTFKAQGR